MARKEVSRVKIVTALLLDLRINIGAVIYVIITYVTIAINKTELVYCLLPHKR